MQKNYEDFINALANGTSVKDLCGQFGICKSTAYNWITPSAAEEKFAAEK